MPFYVDLGEVLQNCSFFIFVPRKVMKAGLSTEYDLAAIYIKIFNRITNLCAMYIC